MGLFTRSSPESTATAKAAAPPAAGAPAPASGTPATTRAALPAQVFDHNPQITERQQFLLQLKTRIHQQLVDRLDVQNLRVLPPETVRGEVRTLVGELCNNEKVLLTSIEQEKLMDDVMDETFGLGPLEALLKDPNITDILVNRYDRVYVERRG